MAYSVEEFRDWMDNEGGYYSLWRHGVGKSDIPDEIKEKWLELDSLFHVAQEIQDEISELIGY